MIEQGRPTLDEVAPRAVGSSTPPRIPVRHERAEDCIERLGFGAAARGVREQHHCHAPIEAREHDRLDAGVIPTVPDVLAIAPRPPEEARVSLAWTVTLWKVRAGELEACHLVGIAHGKGPDTVVLAVV